MVLVAAGLMAVAALMALEGVMVMGGSLRNRRHRDYAENCHTCDYHGCGMGCGAGRGRGTISGINLSRQKAETRSGAATLSGRSSIANAGFSGVPDSRGNGYG